MAAAFDWLERARLRYRQVAAETLPENIVSLLRGAAREAGEMVAYHFIESGTEITYAALLEDVERLACGLAGLGVTSGSHVAVMLPNIREMPTTWLALAAIGAVMVPVNTRYTAHELRYVLEDSRASHLVIHADKLDLVPEAADAQVIVVGPRPSAAGFVGWEELLRTPPGFVPAREPGLDDLVNIQYTSGTTGLPKGCLLSHRYWLTCAKAYSDCDGLRFRRILAANPFFYMTPQWLSLMAFYQRATLYVAPYLSLSRFPEWLRRYQIEFCWFPMDAIVQAPPAQAEAPLALLRGNLAIHRPELHAALEHRYGFPARAAFGMTEIGCGLMMPLAAAAFTGSGSCGMPGPFREARIADADGRTLPAGHSGELLIRGPGLFQGYYRNPDATAAAFHGDWFRTGDLAAQDENGFVTIQGRIKEMIRRAGENISASEVEAALLAIPGIAEAAAVPVPDALRGEEVKAYVVLAEGCLPDSLPPERIVLLCAERLAPFKVPRLIEYRTTPLPRSTSGKVRKPDLLAETPDLRSGSWDRATGLWV